MMLSTSTSEVLARGSLARRLLLLSGAVSLAVAGAFGARTAFAHVTGQSPGPQNFWNAWNLDPLVVLPLMAVVGLYGGGLTRRWVQTRSGRGVKRWQAAAFAGSMLALLIALVWPLDALGESLFAAHMAQHVVLMNIAAPLLILSRSFPTIVYALPRGWRRRIVVPAHWGPLRKSMRLVTGILAATVLQQLALWGWHTPRSIELALRDDLVHALMHGSLLAAALLFWVAISHPRGIGYGRSILALLVTAKLSGLLGVILIFAPRPLYPAYAAGGKVWGLSPLEDQQLAGLIMMPSGGAIYFVAATVLAAIWFGRVGQLPSATSARLPIGRGSADNEPSQTPPQRILSP